MNELFAMKTVDAIRLVHQKRKENEENEQDFPPPIVWVHDYHLMLAANTIRGICDEEGLDIRMGFFLHIPFPSFDIIRIFPWVDEILMGMLGERRRQSAVCLHCMMMAHVSCFLGCDLVAFHTEDYCLNFVDCCQRLLGCQLDRKKMLVQHHGRAVQVKALPIGIPYAGFESMSKTAPKVFPNDVKVRDTCETTVRDMRDTRETLERQWRDTGATLNMHWRDTGETLERDTQN